MASFIVDTCCGILKMGWGVWKEQSVLHSYAESLNIVHGRFINAAKDWPPQTAHPPPPTQMDIKKKKNSVDPLCVLHVSPSSLYCRARGLSCLQIHEVEESFPGSLLPVSPGEVVRIWHAQLAQRSRSQWDSPLSFCYCISCASLIFDHSKRLTGSSSSNSSLPASTQYHIMFYYHT